MHGKTVKKCTTNILSRQILSALFPNNALSKLAHRYLKPNFQNITQDIVATLSPLLNDSPTYVSF